MQDGVVLWGNRVIVHEPGRLPILDELHMKAIQGFRTFRFTHIHSNRQWTQLYEQ